jgi:hypothetical protein
MASRKIPAAVFSSSSPSQTGSVSVQEQVLAEGYRPTACSLWSKRTQGLFSNPSAGMTLAPVMNCKMSPAVTVTSEPNTSFLALPSEQNDKQHKKFLCHVYFSLQKSTFSRSY